MQAGAKTFYSIAAYFFVALLIYLFGTTFMSNDASLMGPEYVGIVAFVLSVLFSLMLAVYLHITSRGMDVLPEDWEEAEVEDAAGIYGFFSPGSIWPFAMAAAIFVLGYGIVFFYIWMIALGAVLLFWTTAMLSLQYGMPKEKH